MPLPILIPIALGVVGLYGIGKTINTIKNNSKTNEFNEFIQQLAMSESYQLLNLRRQQINSHLKWLGLVKLRAKTVFDQFIETFNSIYHFRYKDQSRQSNENNQQENNLKFDFTDFKRTIDNYNLLSNFIITDTTDTSGSILLTLGAYNGTAVLASTDTDTVNSVLNEIGVSNATLAWLDGNLITIADLDTTDNMVILGTVITTPILLALDVVLNNSALQKLDEIYLQLWNTDEFVHNTYVMIKQLTAIKIVTTELRKALLIKIRQAKRLLVELKNITEQKGHDFLTYQPEEQTIVRHTVITIQIIKNLFDTAILNEQGEVITTATKITAIKQGKYITNTQPINTSKQIYF